jgi:hypothetical protein
MAFSGKAFLSAACRPARLSEIIGIEPDPGYYILLYHLVDACLQRSGISRRACCQVSLLRRIVGHQDNQIIAHEGHPVAVLTIGIACACRIDCAIGCIYYGTRGASRFDAVSGAFEVEPSACADGYNNQNGYTEFNDCTHNSSSDLNFLNKSYAELVNET